MARSSVTALQIVVEANGARGGEAAINPIVALKTE